MKSTPLRLKTGILPLRLDNLSYDTDGVSILRDITVDFMIGSRTIVLGPNGAGKSVLMRLCHGLLAPSGGHVVWSGAEAQGGLSDRDIAQRQAMVFQSPVMLRRSVADNVEYPLKALGQHVDDRKTRVDRLLKETGLEEMADRPARVLSGGEQQRLALARAWALDPEVLFLDEPTASLDPTAQRRVEDLIEAISLSGTKIIMTTHDLPQARRLAEDIVFLHRGELLESGGASDFFEKPRTAEAAAFVRGELLV